MIESLSFQLKTTNIYTSIQLPRSFPIWTSKRWPGSEGLSVRKSRHINYQKVRHLNQSESHILNQSVTTIHDWTEMIKKKQVLHQSIFSVSMMCDLNFLPRISQHQVVSGLHKNKIRLSSLYSGEHKTTLNLPTCPRSVLNLHHERSPPIGT